MNLDEASAKLREGPPVDDEEDYELDVWAGVLPLGLVAGEPSPDPRLGPGIDPSPSVARLHQALNTSSSPEADGAYGASIRR